MLRRSTFREIGQSLGRYLAILAIVALGVGFFSGLKVTKADMVSTTNGYLQEHKFFDYELISTLGFDDDSVAFVAEDAHVRTAEGAVSADAIVNVAAEGENVYHAMTVTKTVNTLKLTAGRMPESADECVLDAKAQTKQVLGKYLTVSDANSSDTAKLFKYRKYKVVGLVDSPLYLNFQRGATSLGNGSVTGFFCIPKTGFAADAYTEIYVRLKKAV
jgi:putative ABC transport system permease protein